MADRALPCTLVHQAPCAKGWQSCNTHTVSAALIELLHTSPKPQGSTTTYNQCKESVINNCKKQQTRSWALTGAWSQGYSSWGHCRAPNAQRRAGTHSTTATFCSFKMSNHCYWGFVIKASGNASTTSCAHRGCAGFVHPGDGKRWATTEKNNIIVVLESFVVPPADLTGEQGSAQCWNLLWQCVLPLSFPPMSQFLSFFFFFPSCDMIRQLGGEAWHCTCPWSSH